MVAGSRGSSLIAQQAHLGRLHKKIAMLYAAMAHALTHAPSWCATCAEFRETEEEGLFMHGNGVSSG